MRGLAFAIASVLATLTAAPDAWADCDKVPAMVAAYLAAKPGWKIVHRADLVSDDQALWLKYRGDVCPGLAFADLQGHGRRSYGLSLINGKDRQSVILYDDGKRLLEKVLFTGPGGAREVVHTAPPGPAHEVETNRRVDIRHQSLVMEVMESGAEQYYWHDGRLNSIVISE